MVGDVFGDERGDVEVAVIVSLALLEDGLDVIVAVCGSQQVLRQQLLAGQEVVCCTLVDEELLRVLSYCDTRCVASHRAQSSGLEPR